ncbi:hypothetical protein [Limnochorda pilosa]|uniref:Uncharacterized protein n=1 Tax=Limnochorda pilosa TaxID=1555112 RepID=A0A0K2SM83_LIMPI|nr:hypothetical protein [Limnochorda pilosa]BAS28221.1 hypothetical protein LIP_2380 [Limnochorda pilosa]
MEVRIGEQVMEPVQNVEHLLAMARRLTPEGAFVRRVYVDGVSYEDLASLSHIDWETVQHVRVEYASTEPFLAEVGRSVAEYANRVLEALPRIVALLRVEGVSIAETGLLELLDGISWLVEARTLSQALAATSNLGLQGGRRLPLEGELEHTELDSASFLEKLFSAMKSGDRDWVADLLENDLVDLLETWSYRPTAS